MNLVQVLALACTWPCAWKDDAPRPRVPALAAPVQSVASGQPIAVDGGHAAPFVLDHDDDGKKDLLVGQFAGGSCRIYRNVGTHAVPEINGFELLKAGGGTAAMRPG